MENNYAKKGQQLMKDGKKRIKGSLFGNIFNRQYDRAQEAIDLFKQAATNFKLAKQWDKAAEAYLSCVECDRIAKGGDAAQYYNQVANMKQKVNSAEAIKYLEQSIKQHIQKNRLQQSAKLTKKIAEIYQNDKQWTLASKYYEEASERYAAQGDTSSNYNNCILKVVEICINLPQIDFSKNIKILEAVADKYLQNKLTAPSAKDLLFKATLLHLANDDTIGASQALQKYLNDDPTFYNTRQQKFLTAIIKHINQSKVKQFAQQCYNYNQIIPLDKWKTTILNKIKSLIPGADIKKAATQEQEL